MTKDEAKKMLKAKLECLKRETSGTDIDCNHRNCDECNLCYEQGNMGEQKEALDMAIKALEPQPCEDCISRQAVLDIAKSSKSNWIDNSVLFKRVNELPSVTPKAEWIPVGERLPEEETDILVCNAKGDIEVSSGSYSTEMKNEFIWYTSGWRFGKVVAWMPLPTPYKAESEE